jgi:hypothetical protein
VLRFRERSRELSGRISGAHLSTPGGKAGELALRVEGGQMRILQAAGPLALAVGSSFTRSGNQRCD